MRQGSVASSRPLGRPSMGLRWCESLCRLAPSCPLGRPGGLCDAQILLSLPTGSKPKRLESALIRLRQHLSREKDRRREAGEGEPSAASGGYVGVARSTVCSVEEQLVGGPRAIYHSGSVQRRWSAQLGTTSPRTLPPILSNGGEGDRQRRQRPGLTQWQCIPSLILQFSN
ncbi:MAG: hypothetical protein JWM16_5517 [Verrucomicrobiales bacterium]|nr:hypothetical protein [Verrucomicrobiales bacterium]